MTEETKQQPTAEPNQTAEKTKKFARSFNNRRPGGREERQPEEFAQSIVDLARVTRVMAGGKRMRFRACVAVGDKNGHIGLGLAKGADVSLAMNKAVAQAKKKMLTVPLVDGTIPHAITQKYGAAYVMIKPAVQGKGIIAGGVIRIMAEMAGIHNLTAKILGTNNKVNNAKCMMLALSSLQENPHLKTAAHHKVSGPSSAKATAGNPVQVKQAQTVAPVKKTTKPSAKVPKK